MDYGARLREARRARGLTQRELADLSGIAQPMIARLERGVGSPRVDTLERLLAACGHSLEVRPRLGIGVDRTLFDLILSLSPAERLRRASSEARSLSRIDGARRVG